MTSVWSRTPLTAGGAVDRSGTLVRLEAEVEEAKLRFEVALAIVTDIHQLVADYRGQTAVIDDIVARWRRLEPDEREAYRRSGPPSGLTRFAWDVVDQIDSASFAGFGDESFPPRDVAEEISQRHWHAYVAGLLGEDVETRHAAVQIRSKVSM